MSSAMLDEPSLPHDTSNFESHRGSPAIRQNLAADSPYWIQLRRGESTVPVEVSLLPSGTKDLPRSL